MLLDHKANPNQKDFLGKTAKDWAFMGKYQTILDLLEKSTG
jgi:ankyrin repeat protein